VTAKPTDGGGRGVTGEGKQISAFGQTGPLSAEPGYDYIAQAYAAVTHMIGDPDGPPSIPMLGLGDVSTGAHAVAAIPNAPILSIEQAVNHPHHRARGTVRTIEDRFLGTFEVPGFPLRFSAYPDRLPLNAPVLGENNTEILSMYLGYDAGQIAALEASGVLARGER
jgi:crotonobetainyl-CoA:carnitine CoA-transferase CaiB-like acyl-CoA transferase